MPKVAKKTRKRPAKQKKSVRRCHHRKHEVFEGEDGYWAQCKTCGAYTSEVGSPEEAVEKLKLLYRAAPAAGSGRGKNLPPGQKISGYVLCDIHREKLRLYKERNELDGFSAALRHILEQLEV